MEVKVFDPLLSIKVIDIIFILETSVQEKKQGYFVHRVKSAYTPH